MLKWWDEIHSTGKDEANTEQNRIVCSPVSQSACTLLQKKGGTSLLQLCFMLNILLFLITNWALLRPVFLFLLPCGSAPLPCWWERVKTFCPHPPQHSEDVVSPHCSALLICMKWNLKTLVRGTVAGDKKKKKKFLPGTSRKILNLVISNGRCK